tara:strand:- start:4273 stop:4896 length:624 start_codon:yes stop_codon:yes gene_type:complete
MKLSYAITVCNEFIEIQKLLSVLLVNKREQDEIVVLFDKQSGTSEVWAYLTKLKNEEHIKLTRKKFENHFADWKNYLKDLCIGDYIFQIDADEIPDKSLIDNLPLILEANPNNEVYLVPRVNTVEGLTQEHINKWRWNVNEKGWVNWPDYQWRIWKNKPEIKWVNKVHEKLEGFKTYAPLPAEEGVALYHPKDIVRQEKQNNYYNTL